MADDHQRQRRARVGAWVGPWLRTLREDRDEHLNHVAARLDGVLVTTLSRIERGETFFPSDELPRFLAAYKTTYADFAARDREVRKQHAKRRAA